MGYYDWMLTWNMVLAISTAVMALAIIITAVFAIVQLLNVKKARCSDLLMRLNQVWDSDEYIRSRRTVNRHASGLNLEEQSQSLKESLIAYNDYNAEEYFIMIRVANFFENLGFLIGKKYINRKETLELFGSAANRYWKLFSQFTYYRRNDCTPKQEDAWEYFQTLSTNPKMK